ncbi:Piwi domain-containing protein [Peziza echinospora]|nr:Piwi domain-containing protein [Peziza echinospora]
MLLQHLAGSYTPGLDIEFMVQCLNIVLGDYPRSQRHLNPILNKYFQPNNPIPLDAGIVALKGFYSSVRPSAGQIQCNINVCTSAFLEGGNFAIVMTKIIRKYGTPNSLAKALPALNKLFKKCKVTHTYTGTRKTRTVYSIEQYTASTCTFQIKAIGGEGASGAGYVTTTVLQHFAQAYGLPLRYPDYPLVNVGTREKPINIPPELLEIEAGQRYKGMDPSLTEQMIKLACEGPQNNRERIIEEGLRTLGHHVNLNPAGLPLSTQFGISVSTNMALIPARVLPQPAILYGRKNVLKGSPSNTKSKGAWNLTSRSFLSCTALNMIEFTIFALNLSPLEGRNIRDWLMKPLLSECVRLGMTSQAMDVDRMKYKFVPTVAHGAPNTIRKEQIEQRFIEIASHPGKKMILVILPSKDRSEYALVKYLGDVRYGINTICIQNRHLAPKRRDMVPTLSRNLLGNIAMKVNFKLGGTNHMLYTTPTFLNGKVMIMGMDLTHASPGSLRGAPSIAGVVASCDSEYVNYPASLRLQTPKEDGQGEIISELKDMVRERLKCYQLTNKNALPTAILVYRDGVSEGEYLKMLNDEIPQIQEAWRKVKSELGTPAMTAQMVKITFVVVGKRHHTRFYPHNSKIPSSSTGPQENCLPGTTVDRGITSPYEYEWFSQSHKGLQGTTKPTHYVVLKDDNALSPDALQEITHNLCYTFARCTSAVSVCPPVYYADIVCERGRHYLDSIFCPSSADLKNAQRMQLENIKKDTMDKARSIWGGGVHENLKKVMFYL